MEIDTVEVLEDIVKIKKHIMRNQKSFHGVFHNIIDYQMMNDLFTDLTGYTFTDDGTIFKEDEYHDFMIKKNTKILRDYYWYVMGQKEFLDTCAKNYLSYLNEINACEIKFFNNQNTFSEEEAKEILLDYYSNFDEQTYRIVKNMFDESRISVKRSQYNTGGVYYGSTLLEKSYLCVFKDRINTLYLSYLAHELGHAVEREKFLFPQKKKLDFKDSIGLEIPSSFYEMCFLDYLIKNNIAVSDTIINRNLSLQNQASYLNGLSKFFDISDNNVNIGKDGEIYRLREDGTLVKYDLQKSTMYGIGMYLSHVFCEEYKQDKNTFIKDFNTFLCNRKELDFEENLNSIGYDTQSIKSLEPIKTRIKSISDSAKERYNIRG